uniref:Secreted protein n=1 Tax=Steinernema glaseri TaxID=37863 RepID=A0A1I8ABR0_9BILA
MTSDQSCTVLLVGCFPAPSSCSCYCCISTEDRDEDAAGNDCLSPCVRTVWICSNRQTNVFSETTRSCAALQTTTVFCELVCWFGRAGHMAADVEQKCPDGGNARPCHARG